MVGRNSSGGISKWIKIGVPVAVVVIVAAVVGGVVGSRSSNNSNEDANAASGLAGASSSTASRTPSASGASSVASTATSSTPSATASTPANLAVVPLPAWHWGEQKSIGMCLGNWLVLERWMNEDWFIENAGEALDQWTFSQDLGPERATAVLREHYDTWVTEADIELLHEHGINHLRIPMGFWSWIPTTADEPFVNAGEVGYLELAMQWAHARGMYILIDLHGIPGSQNGEIHSGHLTEEAAFFNNAVNIGRADDTVAAILAWLGNHPYRSVVSGLEVVNEPRPYTPEQVQELSDYYARSYDAIQASAWPIALFLHAGYVDNALDYWTPFIKARATEPPSIVYADHPYPGNFPPQNDPADVLGQVCTAALRYASYPAPICINEWGVYTGIKQTAFEKTFYESQVVTWSHSAGGMYWSIRHVGSAPQRAAGLDYSQYSFVDLVARGVISKASDFGLTNTTTEAESLQYIDALSGNCPAPVNPSPYNDGSFAVNPWTAEIDAVAAQSAALATRKQRKVRRAF